MSKMSGMHMSHQGKSKRPPTLATHNQMIVGKQVVYLSHLPMFMFDPKDHPHNYQVILEVSLSGPSDPQAVYFADRKANPQERMYTMSPDEFEMIEFDPQHLPNRQTLTGPIFRGHLERGGEMIIERAVAQVVNEIYFHEFDPLAKPLPQLDYLLFGKAPELFLAHLITRPPDFDQILAVTVISQMPSFFTSDSLSHGLRVSIPDRANTAHSRVKAREQITGQFMLSGDQTTQSVDLIAGTEFYFEEGELRLPMTMGQTPEEREAGF